MNQINLSDDVSTETRQIHDLDRGTCAAIVVIDTRYLCCCCCYRYEVPALLLCFSNDV